MNDEVFGIATTKNLVIVAFQKIGLVNKGEAIGNYRSPSQFVFVCQIFMDVIEFTVVEVAIIENDLGDIVVVVFITTPIQVDLVFIEICLHLRRRHKSNLISIGVGRRMSSVFPNRINSRICVDGIIIFKFWAVRWTPFIPNPQRCFIGVVITKPYLYMRISLAIREVSSFLQII